MPGTIGNDPNHPVGVGIRFGKHAPLDETTESIAVGAELAARLSSMIVTFSAFGALSSRSKSRPCNSGISIAVK